MTSVTAAATLDRRGKSITTRVVFDATAELDKIREGEILDLLTDNFEPFTHDIAAWCDAGPKASLSENPLLPHVDSASPKLRPAHVAIDLLYATAAEPRLCSRPFDHPALSYHRERRPSACLDNSVSQL